MPILAAAPGSPGRFRERSRPTPYDTQGAVKAVPEPQLAPSHAPVPAPTGLWVRVGVLTPRGRVDLALPADVAVAELVPMVLELIAEREAPGTGARSGAAPGRGAGRGGGVPQPWRFCGPAGGPLPVEATLAGLGVLDGELLHLGPRRDPLPLPVFDDPADALAASVRESAGGDPMAHWAGPLAALAVATAAAAVLATVRSVPGAGATAVVVAVALAVVGAGAALLQCARTLADDGPGPEDDEPGDPSPWFDAQACALAAVPPAAAIGLLALPAPVGAGHVLLASAAAGLAAVCGQAILRVVSAPLLAVAVAAPAVAGAAAARLALDAPVPAVAAGLTALALAVGPLLPRIALRLGGVPDPAVPGDLDEMSRADTPALSGPEMAERAALARGLFAGLSAPAALLAAGGAVVAASGGGWTSSVLVAVTVAVLLLRARAFAEAAPARVLGSAAVLATVGAAVPVALSQGATGRLLVAAGLGLAVLVAARTTTGTLSPVGRRTLDILELLLTAAAIPAALAAMGLFALVRGA